jgi:hypothetical protein
VPFTLLKSLVSTPAMAKMKNKVNKNDIPNVKKAIFS